MSEVASAYVSLIPSARGWTKQVEAEIGSDTARAGQAAGDKAGKSFGGAFGKSAKSVIAGAGIGFGLATAVDLLKDSVSIASDLNESATKTQAIFGQATGAVNLFASKGAKALGQTKLAVLDAAATFGTFGKAAGLSGKDLAKFSTGFVSLSTDMASFFNTDPSEAVEAIGAALRGESEPIRKYGVLLDDATLRQEALRLGLIKTTKEALTPQQKVLAAQAQIYKQTKDAQGDFARTSGGLANQQRILAAQVTDLKGELGKGLLPITTKVVAKASEFVGQMQDGTGAGGDFVDVLSDARDVGKGLLDFFNSIPGPVKKYGAELAIAAIAVSKLNSGLGAFQTSASGFVTSLKGAETSTAKFNALGGAIKNVAGAGGMLLLADSADKAGSSVGALEAAAGGALTGGTIGSMFLPGAGTAIGAGIGGVAAATFNLAKATDEAGNSAKVHIGSWKEYTATLDGVSAATTEQTRAMAYQRLESAGLLGATRTLGLTDRQAVNAVLGVGSARAKLAEGLTRLNVITKEQRAALIAETGAIGKSRLAQLEKNLAVAKNAEEIRKAKRALDAFMNAPASKKITVDTRDATDKLRDLQLAIRQVFGAAKDLNTVGPGGIDVLLTGPTKPRKRRALGGPVSSGQTYLVGERGPELFTATQGGRITSNSQLRSSGDTGRQPTRLVVGEREFVAFLEELADSRVDAYAADSGMVERAFG